MPADLFRLYQRKRIININVNICAAGLLAMLLSLIPVGLTRLFLEGDSKLDMILITAIAGISDLAFDVAIYYSLHWVANHWNRGHVSGAKNLPGAGPGRSFFRDATLIQLERLILSPFYYGTALTLKLVLLSLDVPRELAFAAAFMTAMILTRIVHTVWGVRSGSFRDD